MVRTLISRIWLLGFLGGMMASEPTSLTAAEATPVVPPSLTSLSTTLASLTEEELAALPPELRAELEALKLPVWQVGGTVRASAGWRDNVLLSSVDADDRFFLRGQLETFGWRLPKGDWEWVGFLNGDVTRYLDPPSEIAGEQEWFAHAEVRWQPRPAVRATLTTQGYFQDQVFDLSATEAERLVARLRVQGAMAGGEVRVSPSSVISLTAFGQGHRSDYREFQEDFDEGKVGGRLVWTPSGGVTLTASLLSRRRDYAERPEYTAGGRALTGTLLSLTQQEVELKAQFSRGSWSTSLVVLGLENRDDASGYFDYDERRARLALAWKKERWRLSLEGAGVRYLYRVQTVGTGFDPPRRRREDAEVSMRAERSVRERWTLFAEGRWERSRSNEENASYATKALLAGAAFAF